MAGSAPPSLVTGWNQEFQQTHPGVTVHVDLQQWTDIVTKTDTALHQRSSGRARDGQHVRRRLRGDRGARQPQR